MIRFLHLMRPCFMTFLSCAMVCSTICHGQEPNSKAILDFARDVQPILESRCQECHGPDEAKNDFRIDEVESVSAYIEPGDLESSSLWVDYLITEDSEMLMPPATTERPGGLPGNERAVLKLWIEEGAKWGWATASIEPIATPPLSLPGKVWAFQGLFHPASVHFPVALLMVSGLFSFLALFRKGSFEYVAFHCLWIGALGAVASCIMGWSYAVHEGYGSGFSLDLQKSAIDRHRWLGIVIAVASVLLIPLARSSVKTGAINKRILWCLGSALIAMAVSLVGYQGGELTYGEDHYANEFNKLFSNEHTNTPDSSESQKEATPDSIRDTKNPDAEINADDPGNAPADVKPPESVEPSVTTDQP
jgi:uncharacterized membrane protein